MKQQTKMAESDNLEARSNANVIDMLASYLFEEAKDIQKCQKMLMNGSVKSRANRFLFIVPDAFKGIYNEPFYSSIESVINLLNTNGNSKTVTFKKLYASYNYIRKIAGKEAYRLQAKRAS